MRRFHSALVIGMLLAAATLTPACKKKQPEITPEPPPAEAAPAEPQPSKEVTDTFPSRPVESAPMVEPTIEELNRQHVLKTVYFLYDSSDLSEEGRKVLVDNGAWLKSHPTRKIRIEGHCDERGTVEYNLSLGERRASATRDYLVSLGVDASRMRVVSYGKERPADPGHSEGAWAKNRRADFSIES